MSVDIIYTTIAVKNSKSWDAVQGVVIVFEHHKNSKKPQIQDSEKIGLAQKFSQCFSQKSDY